MVWTTPEVRNHDMAVVQGLTHLIAPVLREMGPLPLALTTPSFSLIAQAAEQGRPLGDGLPSPALLFGGRCRSISVRWNKSTKRGSIFDPRYANTLARTSVLRRLSGLMAGPVMPDEQVRISDDPGNCGLSGDAFATQAGRHPIHRSRIRAICAPTQLCAAVVCKRQRRLDHHGAVARQPPS